jgi:glucose/arabinose dehydrogenase
MRRVLLALMMVACVLGGWVIAAQAPAKAAAPACDADNGGITLPAGFCAAVVSGDRPVPGARHIVVAANGDVIVSYNGVGRGSRGGIKVLRDTNGDGKMDAVGDPFGTGNTTGIALRNGYLYYATPTEIGRYKFNNGDLKPAAAPEKVVTGFPQQNQHEDKDLAFDERGGVYTNVGLPSNACQSPDRQKNIPGQDPCPQLEEHGGIWKFDENMLNQQFSKAQRYASGLRQPVALAWHEGHLFAAMNSRDSLDTLWPGKFTAEENANRPLEPLLRIDQGNVFGWPYCFWDAQTKDYVLAPEYGGDGKQVGRCAQFQKPVAGYPAHYAPVGLMFYTGGQFPAHYRGGAFISFHGSWNRAPLPMAGYNIVFQPFDGANPSGNFEVFADGFKGPRPVMNPTNALARPDGTGEGPDGSLYITDSAKGRIWRVMYKGTGK